MGQDITTLTDRLALEPDPAEALEQGLLWVAGQIEAFKNDPIELQALADSVREEAPTIHRAQVRAAADRANVAAEQADSGMTTTKNR